MRRTVPVERLEGIDAQGDLTTALAAERTRLYDSNGIVETPPSTWRELARDTLRDPMIWFLLGAAVLFASLGDYVEAMTLGVAIVPLIGMDAYLHRCTQASTSGLVSRLADTARVVRDSVMSQRPARNLVPGDLVEVRGGESFPADGLIIAGENLQADESILSGESLPVGKRPLAAADNRVTSSFRICGPFSRSPRKHWSWRSGLVFSHTGCALSLQAVCFKEFSKYRTTAFSGSSGRRLMTPAPRTTTPYISSLVPR